MQLSYPRGASLGVDSASAVIRSDDTQPTVWVTADVAERSESDGAVRPFTFTVHRAGDLSQAASVDWVVAGSGASAADAADFGGVLPTGTIHFDPGETAKVIEVASHDDRDFESDEAFSVTLGNPSGVAIDTRTAESTIVNDDSPVYVWAEAVDASKPEGDTGTTGFLFRVMRSGDLTQSSTVHYSVAGESADPVDAADFGGLLLGGVVTFAPGESEQTIQIAVSGDTDREAREAFALTLDHPTNALVTGSEALGFIGNDDGTAEVSIQALADSRVEGNSGDVAFEFLLTRTGSLAEASTVDFAVAGSGENPTNSSDFGDQWPAGSVTFSAGEAFKLITIAAKGDLEIEPDEDFLVTLANPIGATLGIAAAGARLINDDLPATVSVQAVAAYQPEGNVGPKGVRFELSRSGDLTASSTVFYHVEGYGSESADTTDFGGGFPAGSVTFAPGETSREIVVNVAGDTQAEPNESFVVKIAAVDNAVIDVATATTAILDDDGMIGVSITPVEAAAPEGETGSLRSFLVQRNGDLSAALDVSYRIEGIGQNAADANDFGGAYPSGTISFAAGEFEKTISVPVSADDDVEGSESFQVSASWVAPKPADESQHAAMAQSTAASSGNALATALIMDDSHIAVECRPMDLFTLAFDKWVGTYYGVHSYLIYKPEFGEERAISEHNDGLSAPLMVAIDVPLSATKDARFRDHYVQSNAAILDLGTRNPADVWDVMKQQARNVDALHLGYSVFGPNCHETTATILNAVGFDYSANRPGNYVHQLTVGNIVVPIPGGGSVLGYDYHLDGTARSDIIRGASGQDTLYGGDGEDTIYGGGNIDFIAGGGGNDDLFGGSGGDVFYLQSGNGDDYIHDYEEGNDRLEYFGTSRLSKSLVDYGGDGILDTLIQLTGGGSVTLLHCGQTVSIGNSQSVPEGQTAVFQVSRMGNINAPLTLSYEITGDVSGQGSITFAKNSSTARIYVPSANDTVNAPDRHYTVTILDPGMDTVILDNVSAHGTILDDDPPTRPRGDPHMITLDGLAYDFQAAGEFVLVESIAGEPLSVQMRTKPVGNLASSISAIAVEVAAGHRVTVDTDRPDILRIDGAVISLADGTSTSVGGGSVERSGTVFTITTAAGDVVSVEDFGSHLDLGLMLANGRQPGSVRGLLGNFNQDTHDDLALADGTVLAQPVAFADLYGAFAESWRVSDATSLFDYSPGENTQTFTDRSIPSHAVTLDMLPPTVVEEATRQVDAAGITDPVVRQGAILDFALTHDPDYVIGATQVGDPVTPLEVVAEPQMPQSVLTVAARSDRVPEGNAGTTNLLFDVYRTNNISGELNVSYHVAGGPFSPVNADDLGGALPARVVHFADGQTLCTITIPVTGDLAVENDEQLTLKIGVDDSAQAGVVLARNSATVTVANDDGTLLPRYAIEAIDAIRPEGNDGETTEFSFRVTRTDNSRDAATIDFAVSGLGSDPVDNDDFSDGVLPSGTLAFAPGQTEQTLRLAIAGDSLLEHNERFQVSLASPSHGVIGTHSAIGMIVNDDAFVTRHSITSDMPSRAEGNEGITEFTFAVTRGGNIDVATTVDFVVSPVGSNPADATDFGGVLPAGTISFGVGDVEKDLTIAVAGDVDAEADEGFLVHLSNPSSGVVVGSGVSSTIVNDDLPAPSLSIWRIGADPVEGSGEGTSVRFALVRSGDLAVSSTVKYDVVGNGPSPADGDDFVGGFGSGVLMFEAGQDFKLLTLGIKGDVALESDESFGIVLSAPTHATIDVGSANALIINDDSLVSVGIASEESAKLEGDTGETDFTFAVSRSGDLTGEAKVAYSVSGSVDSSDFVDDIVPAGVVTFAPGETIKDVVVRVRGDQLAEANEAMVLELSSPVNASLGTFAANATILNDDVLPPPMLSIVAHDPSKAEGDNGATLYSFVVHRSGDTSGTSTVDFSLAGTGPYPADQSDFGGTWPSGTVTFAPGEVEQAITVAVTGDTTIEPDEQFSVNLSNATNATLAVASAIAMIENDDLWHAPTLSIAARDARGAEGNIGVTDFSFVVCRSGDLSVETSVSYGVSGVADASDFAGGSLPAGVVVFAPGSAKEIVHVAVAGDKEIEAQEGFTITLHDPVNGALGIAEATGTILNDDSSSFTIGDAPARPSRSDSSAWARSWSHDGVTITHKADLSDASESYSGVLFSSAGSGVLAGGDVSAGDLGVSGQTLATSAVLQEIDGTEGLRFLLDHEANQISFHLSRFTRDDDGTGFSEAGRLQLFDSDGRLAKETFFYADRLDGSREVTVAAEDGFSQAVFSAGAQKGGDFVYGAYGNADGDGYGTDPFANSLGLHGSDFLIDSVTFTAGYVDLFWAG
ncbi:MAG TPA: Calx-beta domain-containing protein [Accumulibacter sp.]|nr:Calx-beta domain-containing protein [Accumulibacter sp.]